MYCWIGILLFCSKNRNKLRTDLWFYRKRWKTKAMNRLKAGYMSTSEVEQILQRNFKLLRKPSVHCPVFETNRIKPVTVFQSRVSCSSCPWTPGLLWLQREEKNQQPKQTREPRTWTRTRTWTWCTRLLGPTFRLRLARKLSCGSKSEPPTEPPRTWICLSRVASPRQKTTEPPRDCWGDKTPPQVFTEAVMLVQRSGVLTGSNSCGAQTLLGVRLLNVCLEAYQGFVHEWGGETSFQLQSPWMRRVSEFLNCFFFFFQKCIFLLTAAMKRCGRFLAP